MALDPYLYIDPLTDDFKDARHSSIYLSFIAECVDKLLESTPPTLSPVEINSSIDALGHLINHNANTYKLACMQIPELEVDQTINTPTGERIARLRAVSAPDFTNDFLALVLTLSQITRHRRLATPTQPARDSNTSTPTALTLHFRKLRREFNADAEYVLNVPMSQTTRTAHFARIADKMRADMQGILAQAQPHELKLIEGMQHTADGLAGLGVLEPEVVGELFETMYPGIAMTEVAGLGEGVGVRVNHRAGRQEGLMTGGEDGAADGD